MDIELELALEVDQKLLEIEKAHEKELEEKFSSIFLYIQANKSKYIDELGIVDTEKLLIDLESKQKELEKFYKEYSNKIEKVSEVSARRDLVRTISNSKDDVLKFSEIFADNSKNYNKNYFKLLAEKQTKDIIDLAAEKVKNLAENSTLSKEDLLKETETLLDKELESFKNTRVKTTIATESDRIVNNIKLEIYEKSGLDPHCMFVGVLDQRITKHICLPRHGLVFTIAFLKQYASQLKPALHPQCRSKIISTQRPLTAVEKVLDILKRFPILKKLSSRNLAKKSK